jgi:hypothetical protein
MLYLRLKGGPFTRNMFLEIETITAHSILPCDSVKYDPENKLVTMLIWRYPLKTKNVGFLRFLGSKRDKTVDLNSRVTIRNVEECIVERNLGLLQVTLLFGVGVRGNRVFITSVEELRGTLGLRVSMTVSDLDLEIEDVEETSTPRK